MKKLILTILLCFLCCNITFAQDMVKSYYKDKQQIDINYSKNIYDKKLAEDLYSVVFSFGEGYYEDLPNVDAEFNDVIYKYIIVSFATVKDYIDTDYPRYRQDSLYFKEENMEIYVNEYLKKGSPVKLVYDIRKVTDYYFRNGYFDDYRVADIFAEYLAVVEFAVQQYSQAYNAQFERMIFAISRKNDEKLKAVTSSEYFSVMLHDDKNYYRKTTSLH